MIRLTSTTSLIDRDEKNSGIRYININLQGDETDAFGFIEFPLQWSINCSFIFKKAH